MTTESFLTTLRPAGGVLAQAGRIGGLGKGERVYSVRIVGDTGYVVTFRQIDPLYTLDLAHPERPRVLGELKIPGYSAYLHPIGEDLLLGIGQDANEDGRPLGTQLSLFDVSDLRSRRGCTRAPRPGLVGGRVRPSRLPLLAADRARDGPVRAARRGYRVGRTRGIDPVGRVEHDAQWADAPLARRRRQRAHGLGAGVKASSLTTLGELGWAAFPPHSSSPRRLRGGSGPDPSPRKETHA